MENAIEIVTTLMASVIAFNAISSLFVALALYSNAPERGEIGFNRYWQTLVADAAPWSGKKC
jgi:hypothetical protein